MMKMKIGHAIKRSHNPKNCPRVLPRHTTKSCLCVRR